MLETVAILFTIQDGRTIIGNYIENTILSHQIPTLKTNDTSTHPFTLNNNVAGCQHIE